MLSFEEAMDCVEEGEKPSVLLGNGFSRAWRDDIFNYQNLLCVANFGDRDQQIRALFERFQTHDFEAISRSLTTAQQVMESYGGDKVLLDQIIADQQLLKDSLIGAISETHPDRPVAVSDAEFESARRLLSRFSSVFSVNYDLLFYWARNKASLQPENYKTDDGFRKGGKWQGEGTSQAAHFLHGGLHIYDNGTAILKHTFSDSGTSIIDLVRDNLQNGEFPLCVCEPTAEIKKRRIEHNPYLNYCFRALRHLQGSYFIIGHSIDENDKHIFDQLNLSRVRNYFVGIYGDPGSESNTRVKANARTFLEAGYSEVVFFDASTVPIWSGLENDGVD